MHRSIMALRLKKKKHLGGVLVCLFLFSVINIKQATWKGNEGVNAVSTFKTQSITKRQAGIQTGNQEECWLTLGYT